MHSSRYIRRNVPEDPFLFCHWFQTSLSIALLAALFMIRSFHPEWIEILMQYLSESPFRVSDIFQIIQKFS